ncbi:hypothetical protein Taro_028276 [Colocasia esculenta]|uniref:Uncharacterized protein n=1 Tax=Colocasia esculenta TaxID=4460 RepID=A0A843VG38_COLES|nr:hypothetical protein [Colocasia esculenta]
MLLSGTPPLLPFFFFPLAVLLCSPSGRKSLSCSSPLLLEKSQLHSFVVQGSWEYVCFDHKSHEYEYREIILNMW